MIKRGNKIIALLVAATSVMSIVPAMASDSTRLGTKDGTIEDAIAYKDGKYAFEGYKTDDNNKSVYFNDGEKDKEINDLTDATINDNSKYGASSTIAWDGNDEYLLDLSNGKVTDEDVASDLQSTAADKLTTKLKKTDRYGDGVSVKLARITPDQFGDVWYEYTGTNGVAGATGGRSAVIKVTPNAFNVNFTVAGHTFTTAGSPGTAGFVSGSKAAFALEAISHSFGSYSVAAKDINAGVIQLTGSTTGAAAAVNLAAIQALSENVTITADTAVDGSVPIKLTVGIKDATKSAKIYYSNTASETVSVHGAVVGGYSNLATFVASVKSDSIPGYTTTVNPSTGELTLTEVTPSDYIQASLAADALLPAKYSGTNTPTLVTSGYVGTGAGAGYDVYHGYTNKSAAYIDVDKTANIRVYNGSKMVKLDEFDEKANDDGVAATVTSSTTIAQDKNFIYRIIDVNFKDATNPSTATLYNSKGTTTITTGKYLQKISKAQGDTEKDAYLPKTVETYELDATISGDAETAATKLATLVSGADKVVGVRVVDGTIYYTEMDDADTIKTYKLKLQKNEKVEAVGTSTKIDAYVVKKDGDKDHDLKGDAGKAGASFDIDGNLWIINEGKIYKSEKAGDFKEMFTCDRSIDSLDVYDAGSLVAWDGNGNVYTTFQEGTKVTQGEATAVAPTIVTGWVQDGANWVFNDVTGAKVTNKWINVAGSWYFLKDDGSMATGWYNVNGTWYFLNPVSDGTKGAMKTGWLYNNGTWYFLKTDGSMATGWLNDNGTWYFLNTSGAMLANTTVNGYRLNASGAWVK